MRLSKNLNYLLTACFFFTFYVNVNFAQNVNYTGNRKPLIKVPYIQLPIGNISAKGWLLDQLKLSATGMTGHLDEIWSDVGPNNGWLGGTGDSWERGPYWLDGLVPLAYTLKDPALIKKAKKWIEWTLNSQTPDGEFGPRPDSSLVGKDKNVNVNKKQEVKLDWWPRMVMLKVLQSYYEATHDQRVITFLTKYFKYQLKHLPSQPLNHWTGWAKSRGGENIEVVYWLYNHTGDEFLLKLGDLLFKQTENWTKRFESDGPHDWHGVNTAMGVKEPGVYYQYSKEDKYINAANKGIHDLMKYDGQPNGLFSADELLSGTDPTQGTEFCTVVEYMFSLETLLKISGSPLFADALEKAAYNALPAQSKPDFTGRQYYQQANQIACDTSWHNFNVMYHNTSTLFGLDNGYGCCTANYHQGWPKYTDNLWYATEDNGLAALMYAPCEVTAKVAHNVQVTFNEETNYPFTGDVKFTYTKGPAVNFPLQLRIPRWCDNASIVINGKEYNKPKADTIITISRRWKQGDIVVLNMPMKIRLTHWYKRAAVVQRGPLVYSLKIEGNWKKITGKGKYATYSVEPENHWNYALLRKNVEHPDSSFQVKFLGVKGQPWEVKNAPIEITTTAKRDPNWKRYGGSAGPLPYTPYWEPEKLNTQVQKITLIPYGCTTLRITEFPVRN